MGAYSKGFYYIKVQVQYCPYSNGFFDTYNGIAEEILSNGNGTYVHNALYLYSQTPTLVHTLTNTNKNLPAYAKPSARLLSIYTKYGFTELLNYIDSDYFSNLFSGSYNINAANLYDNSFIDSNSFNSVAYSNGLIFAGLGANNFLVTNGKFISPLFKGYTGGVSENNTTYVIDGNNLYACLISGADFYSFSTASNSLLKQIDFNDINAYSLINHSRPISAIGKFKS